MHRSNSAERPHSPFEALLAVSNMQSCLPTEPAIEPAKLTLKQASSPSNPSKQSAYSHDGNATQLLQDSLVEQMSEQYRQDGVAEQGEKGPVTRPERVGTSGGGESGDTENSSEVSKEPQGEGYAREEGSEVHTGPRSGGWGARSTRRPLKKQRMIWTQELHERFLNAVNHIGMDNAVPKVILRMMNVDGMTRENVASHLQKYRLHLKRTGGSMPPDLRTEVPPSQVPTPAAVPSPGIPPVPPGTIQGVAASQAYLAQQQYYFTEVPALGLPIGTSLPNLPPGNNIVGVPCTSYIPPQAWAAGVPGYDALQTLQNMRSHHCLETGGHNPCFPQSMGSQMPAQGLALGQLPGFPASSCLPATQAEGPLLDIKPLSTMPPSSAAKE